MDGWLGYLRSQIRRIHGFRLVDPSDYSQYKVVISGPGGRTKGVSISARAMHKIEQILVEDYENRPE